MKRALLAVAVVILASPVLADCVSCGPGGECYSVSDGFSGNCECKIRSQNGVAVCRPSGVCDPNDDTSCDTGAGSGFPVYFVSTAFVKDLSEVNPLLAGAVWAGLAEANSARHGAQAEVKGTMGQNGRSYTYRTQLRFLPKRSISLAIQVQEDGAPQSLVYEGTLTQAGRNGRFVQVGPKGTSPVFAWSADPAKK